MGNKLTTFGTIVEEALKSPRDKMLVIIVFHSEGGKNKDLKYLFLYCLSLVSIKVFHTEGEKELEFVIVFLCSGHKCNSSLLL